MTLLDELLGIYLTVRSEHWLQKSESDQELFARNVAISSMHGYIYKLVANKLVDIAIEMRDTDLIAHCFELRERLRMINAFNSKDI